MGNVHSQNKMEVYNLFILFWVEFCFFYYILQLCDWQIDQRVFFFLSFFREVTLLMLYFEEVMFCDILSTKYDFYIKIHFISIHDWGLWVPEGFNIIILFYWNLSYPIFWAYISLLCCHLRETIRLNVEYNLLMWILKVRYCVLRSMSRNRFIDTLSYQPV